MKIKLHQTLVWPVVLYGCETWSLTSREEHKLREFKNSVLREILGPKREEVTRYWRKLHNEELHALYSSPNIVRLVKLRTGDGLAMWHVWGGGRQKWIQEFGGKN